MAPLVSDAEVSMEVAGLAGLALGLVFTSSAKDDVVMALLQVKHAGETGASKQVRVRVLGLGSLMCPART